MFDHFTIGVFDSGIGGLTVLKELVSHLPNASFVYFADTAYAPYGKRSQKEIASRSLKITDYLLKHHDIDALVVACNSATTSAIGKLRERYQNLVIVGTEPGIKPALRMSRSGNIGVLATEATLNSAKYRSLTEVLIKEEKRRIKIFEQACPELVGFIENDQLSTNFARKKMSQWLEPMRKGGVDTIVLGCTHYPLAKRHIQALFDKEVTLVETSTAIANRLVQCLEGIKCDKGDVTSQTVKIQSSGTIDHDLIRSILGDITIDFIGENKKI